MNKPARQVLEITSRVGCRNCCSYCAQDVFIKKFSQLSPVKVMSERTFRKAADKLPRVVGIDFAAFAEPFLNPAVPRMIEYAYKQGREIAVFTTAVGLRLEDIPRLRPIPFRSFVVHLPDDQGQTAIKVDAAYLVVVEELLKNPLKNISFLCHRTPAGKENFHPRLRPLLTKYPARERHWPLMTWAGKTAIPGREKPARIKGKLPPCERLKRNIMLPDGTVVLCCMDWGMRHVLGNLLRDRYEDLFTSPAYQEVLKGFSDEKIATLCRFCDSAAMAVKQQKNGLV